MRNIHFSEASESLCFVFPSLSEDSSPETLELFRIGWRFFLPITEPSLSSDSAPWDFDMSGDVDCDFFDVTLFGLVELDFDLLLLDEALLWLVEWLAWDVSLFSLTTDWLDATEPVGDAERADADAAERSEVAECADAAEPADTAEPTDAAEAALEDLLPGDGEREPAGDFEGLFDAVAEPDALLDRDLDAGEAGSDPDGVWAALTGEADLDDWLLLFADDELETDSESLTSKLNKNN